MASLCLNTYGFNILHIDDRPAPSTAGRADGIQPRTIEVLRNIGGVGILDNPGDLASGGSPFKGAGVAKKMISQGVRVYEVAFWDPTDTEKLARTSRAASCPDFIDVVDNYTLLLHQGRIEHAFLDEIEARRVKAGTSKSTPPGGVQRPFSFKTCRTVGTGSTSAASAGLGASADGSIGAGSDPLDATHPVECIIVDGNTKKEYKIRSKYLLGCDGAKSLVRRAIAGGEVGDGEWQGKIQMKGEATDIVWGVIDAEVKTDFPDILYKTLIHSRDAGSIMTIPRESNLTRFYVQLQAGEDGKGAHYTRDSATQDICIARAKKIFEPFQLEFGYVDWFSVYQIGQRIATNYTLDQRVFLGGDATHTHSPKAGQGMNISMLDMYSLAWKLNLIEKGVGSREVLLPTYEQERRGVAEELLKFDSEYSRLFSGRGPSLQSTASSSSLGGSSTPTTDDPISAKAPQAPGPDPGVKAAVDAEKFIGVFKKNAFFTSGCGAVYFENALNALPNGSVVSQSPHGHAFNPSGGTLIAGQRLTPGKVTRVSDANQVRLQQQVKMNGAFRIHIFAGDLPKTKERLAGFAKWIDSPESFFNLYRPQGGVKASVLDGVLTSGEFHSTEVDETHRRNPFFAFLTVVATHYYDWEIDHLPGCLRLYRDQVYCDNIPDHRVPVPGNEAPLHHKYGVDRSQGQIIVVRPDGYVGAVVPLAEEGWLALSEYFAGFLVRSVSKPRL
ncbi:phenol 2-monooxygenase [Pterulicium gracile]|uniref:Phenol 2-monooxygenase n=1 Tax=Pterulicium gracile TaxID=1884261 RepID=A0A5C3QQB6_9AGAR|nr:phenol 2-monooxygenase [Pterula gracilis]